MTVPDRRRRMVLSPILALAFLFYYWIGTTNGVPVSFGRQHDFYNQLASAFLRGRLSLLLKPPKALLALKDPYNSVANAPWQAHFHDLALYHSHFYLTWGPTPILTLLLPWRLLQLGDMPIGLGTVIFCCLGLLFAVALLCALVDHYFPRVKSWQLGLAAGALALSNIAPFMLRRPDVYELAISCGYCFAMLGAFLIVSGGLPTPVRPWRIAFGSLSIGLAVGGRPTLVFEGLLLVVLFAYLVRREDGHDRGRRTRLGGLVFGPFVVVLGLLFAYNAARFGSLLQYGAKYQLESVEQLTLPYFRLSYLPPSLYYYVAAPVRWTLAFPYFTLPPPPVYPGVLPLHYSAREITGGLLTTTPIVAALVPGAVLVLRRRRLAWGIVMGSSVVVGVLVLLFVSLALGGTTMRYEADFATFFVLAALLSWFALTDGRGWGRRVAAVVGAAAIVYGCVVGAAISLYGYSDQLRTTDPRTYWAIDRATSFIPTLATIITGHPSIVRVVSPQFGFGNSGTYAIGTTPFLLYDAPVEVDIVSPRAGTWDLAPTFRREQGVGARPLYLVVRANGHDHQLALGPHRAPVALSLKRGLNRVQVTAWSPGAGPFRPLVYVDGLRLAGIGR